MSSAEVFRTRRIGFNFQWLYSWEKGRKAEAPDRKALEFMAQHGFNFVRIPCDYRFWTDNHPDYEIQSGAFEAIDRCLEACTEFGLHMSLNIHRGPGYCINYNNLERHNLWQDSVAQDAFTGLWKRFAERYRGVSSERLSFDLINEPPDVDQYGMSRDVHEALIRRVHAAIRHADPDRAIVIDGLAGGNLAMPELSDLDVVHSGRGYQPMSVSHYQASWWSGSGGLDAPSYPYCVYDGKVWNRAALFEYYQPWRDLANSGVAIHIGEFGCYDRTPQHVAIALFRDLFSVYNELKWGYAFWQFEGPFGVIGHERPGTRFENYQGYRVDRDLLDLLLLSRGDDRANTKP